MDKDKDIQYYPKVTDIVGIPTRDSCNGATKLLTLTTHVLKSLLLFFFFQPNSTKSCHKMPSMLGYKENLSTLEARVILSGKDVKCK